MAYLIDLKTMISANGNLTVIEKVLPFDIKRIFYIYGVDDSIRGRHRHKTTIQAAICIKGECKISNQPGEGQPFQEYMLDSPAKCLVIEPPDWHFMDNFTEDAILMVLASEYYNSEDYIYTPYEQ